MAATRADGGSSDGISGRDGNGNRDGTCCGTCYGSGDGNRYGRHF